MPLFVCDECLCIDNTSTGHFWGRGNGLYKDPIKDAQALCCVCAPKEYTAGLINDNHGKWHGRFEHKCRIRISLLQGITNFECTEGFLKVTGLETPEHFYSLKECKTELDRIGRAGEVARVRAQKEWAARKQEENARKKVRNKKKKAKQKKKRK